MKIQLTSVRNVSISKFSCNVFNEKNVCSACESHKLYYATADDEWKIRKKKFEKILMENKSTSNYDCIIPVSGGKDTIIKHIKLLKNLV